MPTVPTCECTFADVPGEKRDVLRDESIEGVATLTCECELIGETVVVPVCVCGRRAPELPICGGGGREGLGADVGGSAAVRTVHDDAGAVGSESRGRFGTDGHGISGLESTTTLCEFCGIPNC